MSSGDDASESRDDEARFRAVADSTYDWESWIAPDGRTEWVNPAVERLTGYTVDECLAMSDYPLSIVHPDDRELLGHVLRGALSGSSGNDFEFRVRRKDGGEKWAAISWQPMFARDGRCIGYRSSVRDMDERKRFERRLREAQERAELAARAKSDFLAHLSHELRNPLQCVAGFAELLEESSLDERQRHWVSILAQQSDVLLRQMEDLLAFASLDVHDPTLESKPLDLVDVARSAALAFAPRAAARGLSLSFEASPDAPRFVRGDAARITQILGNLLQNALKFTERGVVRLSIARQPSGAARLEVSDSGIGIPEDEIGAILEPFTQGSVSSVTREGGVGLGLSIVNRLVRVMGGTLDVWSRVGVGTTVTVTLPLPRCEEAREMPGREARAGDVPSGRELAEAHALSILVVDDSAPSRELVLEMLRVLGYAPEAAVGGQEAIACVNEGTFDLVLLDYQMPDLDGLAVAERIRALSVGHVPTIVLLTANVFVEAERPRGVDLILTKPVRLGELRDLLRQVALGDTPHVARATTLSEGSPLDANVLDDLRTTHASDGHTMLERIVPRVLGEATTLLAALRRAVADGVFAEVSALAHRFRGNALLVGARQAALEADAVERAAEHLARSSADSDSRGPGDPHTPGEALSIGVARIGAAWAVAEKALQAVANPP